MRPNTIKDFWKKVLKGKPNECWEWQGTPGDNGYGFFTFEGVVWTPAQFSAKLHLGYVRPVRKKREGPSGTVIRHKCNNRICVNPNHLLLGTQTDNVKDRDLSGRTQKGESHFRAVLTESQVKWIRKNYRPYYMSAKKLADHLKVSALAVSAVVSGQTWKHI